MSGTNAADCADAVRQKRRWQQVSTLAEVALLIVDISLVGAEVFAADAITTLRGSQTRAGRLHSLFGILAVLGIPITATVVDWSLSGNPLAAPIQSYLPKMSLMVWLRLLAMMSAFVFYGAKKIPLGPHACIGWPNRFMVFTYVAWLLLIAGAMR